MFNEIIFIIIFIMAILIILSFILCMIAFSKCSKLKNLLHETNNGNDYKEFEKRIIEKINTFENNTPALSNTVISTGNTDAFKNIGIVKFDAFKGITGAYSFSVAITNDKKNGFILTSLYGHETSNVYLREIKNGISDTELLEEEKKALQKSLSQ